MPKKPTSPYGYISFSKDGKVQKHISTLSQDKTIQEKQVVGFLLSALTAIRRVEKSEAGKPYQRMTRTSYSQLTAETY